MAKRRVLGTFEFDKAAWGRAISQANEDMGSDLPEYLGVSRQCIRTWSVADYAQGYEHPSMFNFLRVCDLCDLNPSDFFTWEER